MGQRRGVPEALADRRPRARGLSPCFRIGRIERPRAPKGLWFTITEAELRQLMRSRRAPGKVRTARKKEVSGDESGRAPLAVRTTPLPTHVLPSKILSLSAKKAENFRFGCGARGMKACDSDRTL